MGKVTNICSEQTFQIVPLSVTYIYKLNHREGPSSIVLIYSFNILRAINELKKNKDSLSIKH